MEINDIPTDLQSEVYSLKHGSLTIQCDVDDAIDQAENWKDAQETIEARMDALIGEAKAIINTFCN